MPDSGSGVGTPITINTPPGGVYDQYEELTPFGNCAIPLSRYAKLIGYDECAFWGVIHEAQYVPGCDSMWTEWERMTIAQALAEAQAEIEQVVGYPLCPTWVVGRLADEPDDDPRWVDSQDYRIRQVTRYSRLIAPGIRAVTQLAAGAAVNHASDPAVVGPIATTAIDARDLHVFYPGSNREITPSSVIIADGSATISIPRCRVVKPDLLNNPQAGLEYDIVDNFLPAVDIRRIYNDPSTQAVLVRPHCRNDACAGGCSECTQTACIYVRDAHSGIVDVTPATYDAAAGEWNRTTACRPGWSLVRLHYQCGLSTLSLQVEQAIWRLAHAKMPQPPCSCDRTTHLWQRDQKVPEVLTRERLNCPFGLENGAWTAWKFAQALAAGKASVL